jgi:hypothetical protein
MKIILPSLTVLCKVDRQNSVKKKVGRQNSVKKKVGRQNERHIIFDEKAFSFSKKLNILA